MRKGIRAPLVTTVLLLAAAIVWGWSVPGYAYLLAFRLMGAGELGGAYFPNYAVSISSASSGVRNLSLLTLVGPVRPCTALCSPSQPRLSPFGSLHDYRSSLMQQAPRTDDCSAPVDWRGEIRVGLDPITCRAYHFERKHR